MKPSRFAANRNAKHAAKNTMSIDVDMDALDDLLQELGDQVNEAVRPAAQAAAEVLYQAVKQNVRAIGQSSGSLEASIYQKYSTDNSSPTRAEYHISWRTSGAVLTDTGQNKWTGMATAPHGSLLEHGYIQRYASYVGKNGHWYTAVKPEMRGKKKPRRGASQSEKDAYYVPRPGGPVQHPAQAFMRRAQDAFPQAMEAAKAELLRRIP